MVRIPAGNRIRPTASRVREALFSILAPRIPGAQVLDAYAGSGALGFEALSRGAARVVFVELAPPAVRGLEENARALGVADKVEVVRGRALDRLARVPAEYDLILADPPYGLGEEDAFLRAAVPRLAPGGLVVLERDIHAAAVETPEGLSHERSARYGTNRLELFARVGSDHHG